MNRTPVTSSNLQSVGYDPARRVLEIAFKGGGVYQYFVVPPGVHRALMAATSKGKYFHANIKNNYRRAKVG